MRVTPPGSATGNKTASGRESVWDYPRPPRLEPTPRRVCILRNGQPLADSTRALRMLETSHPPVYYLPKADLAMHLLRPSTRPGSVCEWKGIARYWDLLLPDATVPAVAWSYATPMPTYAALADHLAFYPSHFQPPSGACTVNGEQVQAQPGDFYGGWITSDLVGPFKGAPGTLDW